MNIVVLDGYTLNPGDLSWERLEKIGNLKVYDRTPEDLILERAYEAEIVFTNKTPLKAKQLEQLTQLKYIGVLATGYDVVDVQAAARRNIIVSNIPTYGTASVSQMVFGHLLTICNKVQVHSDRVRAGAWSNSQDWCFWEYPLMELANKNMGLIGFGRIGQQTAQIASSFGMNILYHDILKADDVPQAYSFVDLDRLLAESDVISLHCPLTPQTEGIINKHNIAKMKPSAILINTSRGKLVVENDLAEALNQGRIAWAGLDVLSVEPPQAGNPLLSAKNCLVTPHISWATAEARSRLMDIAVDNLKAFLNGQPIHVVS